MLTAIHFYCAVIEKKRRIAVVSSYTADIVSHLAA
jgi:hypothetical protein